MALTPTETERLSSVEEEIISLTKLLKGAGGKNQLNRLYVLAQKSNADLETRVVALEGKIEELLNLARKLQ
jgi:hypothetical protein